jgi:hypothetical protein
VPGTAFGEELLTLSFRAVFSPEESALGTLSFRGTHHGLVLPPAAYGLGVSTGFALDSESGWVYLHRLVKRYTFILLSAFSGRGAQ